MILEIIMINYRCILFILIFLLHTGNAISDSNNNILSPNLQTWLSNHKHSIRFAPSPNYPPVGFVNPDNIFEGITADYLRLLEKVLHFKFQIVYCKTWNEIIQRARNKEIDVIGNIQATPEREKFLSFTQPYVTIPNAIIVRKDTKEKLKLEMMKGMKVVLVKGYATLDYVSQKNKEILIKTVSDNHQGLVLVSFGRADAMITDLGVASYFIKQYGITNLRIAGKIDFNWNLAFASRKDWPELHQILESGLESINSSTRQDIFNKWIQLSSEPIPWQWFLAGIVFITFVVSMILLWIFSLKRLVKLQIAQLASDLKERKKIESKLRERESFLRILLDAIPFPVFYKDISGKFLGCNPAFELFWGLSKEHIIGKTVFDIVKPEDAKKFSQMDSEAIRNGKMQQFQGEVKNVNGEARSIIFDKAVFKNEQGNINGLIGIILDITELKKAEREKKKIEVQFYQAQKMQSIGRLASGVAHDMNNLLAPILGNCEILLEDSELSNRNKELIEIIMKAGLRARNLVRQLLAFSNKQTLEFKVIDINDLILNFEKLLRRTIREDIAIHVNLSKKSLFTKGDTGQIEQIIMNLAVNAQDAMPDGGKITIETSQSMLGDENLLKKQHMPSGSYVAICVSDTGMGIDKTDLEFIFEPFFTTKDYGKGTGLGLSTVYGIARQHGGGVWVYSEVNIGTTIKVLLPSTNEKQTIEQHTVKNITNDTGTETILVTEDDNLVRELACKILKGKGYNVLVASGGDEALSLLASYDDSVDLLLTDVIMPKMNGKELYEKIRKKYKHIKVMYMSGYTDNIIAEQGVLDDNVQLIQKPFHIQNFTARIRKLLDHS